MSADTLRKAAALMRERAEAATSGEWSDGGAWWEHWTDPEGRQCHTPWPTVTTGPLGSEIVAKTRTEADAAHFASWHPAVALAVADWLDDTAAEHETDASSPESVVRFFAEFDTKPDLAALSVAREYLGSDA